MTSCVGPACLWVFGTTVWDHRLGPWVFGTHRFVSDHHGCLGPAIWGSCVFGTIVGTGPVFGTTFGSIVWDHLFGTMGVFVWDHAVFGTHNLGPCVFGTMVWDHRLGPCGCLGG